MKYYVGKGCAIAGNLIGDSSTRTQTSDIYRAICSLYIVVKVTYALFDDTEYYSGIDFA